MAEIRFPVRAEYTGSNPTGFTEYQTSDTLKILDSAGNTSILLESSNDTAATEWSALDIYRNAANPLDGDVLGSITFSGEDSAGNKTSYAGLRTLTTDVTSDTEDGSLQFQVVKAGTLTTIGQIDAAGLTITGVIGGSAVKDEDTMSSDSNTHLATQQSIKAYVDTQILTKDTIAELNDTTIASIALNDFLVYDTTGTAWKNLTPANARTALGVDAAGTINYTHPTHDGDDINIDTAPLTGAAVISDLDFNVTTDALGHVTDANAAISTRTLTATNIGAATTGKAIAMAIVFG